jgi:hypothetical protein
MKYIDISTKTYPNMFTKVSDEDYEDLIRYRWCVRKHQYTFYVGRSCGHGRKDKRCMLMHRYIMGVTERSQQVDHRDRDGLNNVRENLRVCINGQNQANTTSSKGSSKYKGVYKDRKNDKWCASITKDRVNHWIGRFDDEAAAARAYDFFAQEAFGDFARLNFPA